MFEFGNEHALLLCLPVGIVLKYTCRTYLTKKISTTFVGILLLLGLCGYQSRYSFFAIVVNIAIIKNFNRYVGLISLAFCFSFHIYVKYITQLDTLSPGVVHTIQMLFTLKLSGAAFDIEQFRNKSKHEEKNKKYQLGLESEPSSFDLLCFSFCYFGIFSGPTFRYRTYYDFIRQPWRPYCMNEFKSEWWPRLLNALWLSPYYFFLRHFFDFPIITSEFFAESPIFVRYFYMIGTGFHYRSQFELAWTVAELHCVIVGFGAYPKESKPRPGFGPTVKLDETFKYDKNTEYSYETIQQVWPVEIEMSTSLKVLLRKWNMTTQWWMYNYVYNKMYGTIPYRKVRLILLSIFVVLYHGLFFSYFVTFVSAVGIVLTEIAVEERTKEKPINFWILNMVSMRITDFIQVTLLLQTWDVVLRFYQQLWFLPIVTIIVIWILLIMFPKKSKKKTN